MEIIINGETHQVPSDLNSFTLGQFIKYWNKDGRDLDEQLRTILDKEYDDEFERDIDLLQQDLKEAMAWYTFFTGFDFSSVQGVDADTLVKQYNILRTLLRTDEEEQAALVPATEEFNWQGDMWMLSDYRTTPTSGFIFNELLTSKEITRQIYSLGKGRWEALPYLCAVFLRKKNEPFTDWLTMEESGRIKLMHELPMAFAMRVAFFLTISVSTWSAISVSLKPAATVSPE